MDYYFTTNNNIKIELPYYMVDRVFTFSGRDLFSCDGSCLELADIFSLSIDRIEDENWKSAWIVKYENLDGNECGEIKFSSISMRELLLALEIYEFMKNSYHKEFTSYEIISINNPEITLLKHPSAIVISRRSCEDTVLPIANYVDISSSSFDSDCEMLYNKVINTMEVFENE